MGRVKISLCQLTLFLWLVVCSGSEDFLSVQQRPEGHPIAWCVARMDVGSDKLQKYIDFVCSKLDCHEIQPGGSCYEPNTLQNHASYALNLEYRVNGVCPSDIGMATVIMPVYGKCHYP